MTLCAALEPQPGAADAATQVLERGERLDDVAAKSETMRDQAAAFRNKGRQLRRQMWWQNVKWTLLLVIVVLLVAFAVFLAACRGFSCVK